MVERSRVIRSKSLNGRKLERSFGIVPQLLMRIICSNEGRTGDGDDNINDGARCFSKGICDRPFSPGVVMNILVSKNQ